MKKEKIPIILTMNNKTYSLVKIYPNFALYEDLRTKTKEAFDWFELGLIEEIDRNYVCRKPERKPHIKRRTKNEQRRPQKIQIL